MENLKENTIQILNDYFTKERTFNDCAETINRSMIGKAVLYSKLTENAIYGQSEEGGLFPNVPFEISEVIFFLQHLRELFIKCEKSEAGIES